jgi:hypothetical protein
LPPDAVDGFQLHFGPADLDDPASVAPFVLAPGEETVGCAHGQSTSDGEAFFSSYVAALRAGTHHVLVNPALAGARAGAPGDCSDADPGAVVLLVQGGVGPGGARIEYPSPSAAQAPENRALASRLSPRERLVVQMHSINTTEKPILREAWVNIRFTPPGAAMVPADRFTLYTGLSMSIPPHTRQVVSGICDAPTGGDVRVVDVFGHMHSHGRRVSAWHVSPLPNGSEQRALVYESYDWSALERVSFDSVTQTPVPDPANKQGGGASGLLTLHPGDKIAFECEFDNNESFPLEFAARTDTAEMCGLIGTYAPSTGSTWYCGVD